MASSTWALSQLSHILPLDEQSLQDILHYTSTLSKDASAEHLRNLLGTSPKALEFISSYNSRREAPKADESRPSTPEASEAPRKQPRKKKQPLNKPFNPRQPDDYGNTAGGYQKHPKEPALANTLALSEKPDARQLPMPAQASASSKKPPSASGPLISDLPNVRAGSRTTSRTSSPAPKTKINVAGGASMHGASTTLQDLAMLLTTLAVSLSTCFPITLLYSTTANTPFLAQDSAIRALELQTNPSLTPTPTPSRACPCNATRHPLLAAAPNCLSCGKIICVKEGIGPCTFCSAPLLSPSEIDSMIRTLRSERGKEKQSFQNSAHKRADLATTPRPFASSSSTTTTNNTTNTTTSPDNNNNPTSLSLSTAQHHLNTLLHYQSQNARRTHIIDQAADYDTPVSGQNMWASPVERARQLKAQQKVLREQEWDARPEWEKRKVVLSLDVVGGKAVRRMGMGKVKGPREEEDVEVGQEEDMVDVVDEMKKGGKGAFSKNPLMSGLIRPVWKGKGKANGEEGVEAVVDGEQKKLREKDKWRRVQDDNEDNEAWILDGGVYGGTDTDMERRLGEEEHAFG
ncbi:MAG: hypothetical protein Q9208_006747 [Pyrenodesmia sp. 3 TL-2023]